jgi:hypothetical protein
VTDLKELVFNIQLSDVPILERDWSKRNFLRCLAISSPAGDAPGLFELRSVWDTTISAPWDCVHYSGWARDPEYGRQQNQSWSVALGAEQAFSFLIDAMEIREHLASLGFK